MMIEYAVDTFINTLKENPYFDDIQIMHAYPCSVKPTQLSKTVIAVGINDIELSPSGLGEESCARTFAVFADIFVPWKKDNTVMSDILKNICSAVCGMNIVGIKAQRIAVDNSTGSYVLKSVFTFSDNMKLGGDSDE